MNLTIQSDLAAKLRARADAEGVTVEVYFERITREDEQAEEELEALAIEGLNSGDAILADDQYWDSHCPESSLRNVGPGF